MPAEFWYWLLVLYSKSNTAVGTPEHSLTAKVVIVRFADPEDWRDSRAPAEAAGMAEVLVTKAMVRRKRGVSACIMTVSGIFWSESSSSTDRYCEIVGGDRCSREVQPDWSYVNYEILVNKACGPRSCGTRVAIHTESFVFQSQSSFGN